MNGLAAGPFGTNLALTAAVVLFAFLATWALALRMGRWNVVDVAWGMAFVVIALASFFWSGRTGGVSSTTRGLAFGLTTVWGLRLSLYIWWRSRGQGEDPRYAEILGRALGHPARYALVKVYLPQAFLAWVVSMPVQLVMYQRTGIGPVGWVGVPVWAAGLFFETVGDAQLAAFRRQPAETRGPVMDQGLWRYTRHPNYFGDALVWTGLFLIGAGRWPGILTIVSPLVMLYFLYAKSGKGLLERRLAAGRPGYREYMQRTSGFVPMPPRQPRG